MIKLYHSMIFLHSSAIACSSSDNNSVNCQKNAHTDHVKTKEYGKYDKTKEQRKQRDCECC